MSAPSPVEETPNIQGTITLLLPHESGEKEYFVPDPDALPRSSPLTPTHLHILKLVRENLVFAPQDNTEERFDGSELIIEDTEFTSDPEGMETGVGIDSGSSSFMEDGNTPTESESISSGRKYRLLPWMNARSVCKLLEDIRRNMELHRTNAKRMYRFHQRLPSTQRSPTKLRKKRLQRALRMGNPFETGVWKCCSRYQCFQMLGAARCYEEYKAVNTMNPKQAKRTLIGMYDQVENVFRLSGQVVCSRFLAKCLGLSNDLQCAIKNTPRARGSAIARSRPREVKRNTKRLFIVLFIKRLAQMFGDAMPHKDHVTLPVLNRKALWQECQEEWKRRGKHGGDVKLSQNYFYRVWRTFLSVVTVRKNNGFMVCSKCESLREEMTKHLKDEDTLRVLIDQHAAHLKFVEKERNAYEERQTLAERNPDRYCSIIVDGADQKNYGLPHFANSTKSDAGHKLKVKVVGVLEHILRGKEWLSLFTMTEEYETGANHIIEAVHQALQRKKNKLGKLPPVLFVQVDNCIRENKNRYFMAYFQSLVHLGVFKIVQISFLPIGHTHADIDQTFSSISSHLKINNAITLRELIEELEKCYARRVAASELRRIINYSGLCEASGCLNDVDSFSEYRYFRFLQKKNESSASLHESSCDVKVQNDDAWVPFPNSQAQGFLKFVPCLAETPATQTKELTNKSQVTKCLDAAEERIGDGAKSRELTELKNRVYEVREEPYHWCESSCFELNGDYLENQSAVNGGIEDAPAQVEEALRPNYGYDPDDFVAIATNTDPNTRFWIGRVKDVSEVDTNGRAKNLSIRWYVASGTDPYAAKYTPAWRKVGGEQSVYEDNIDACSVLVRFESLTNANRLRVRDKKAIKQTLNEN